MRFGFGLGCDGQQFMCNMLRPGLAAVRNRNASPPPGHGDGKTKGDAFFQGQISAELRADERCVVVGIDVNEPCASLSVNMAAVRLQPSPLTPVSAAFDSFPTRTGGNCGAEGAQSAGAGIFHGSDAV